MLDFCELFQYPAFRLDLRESRLRSTACMRFTDQLAAPDGDVVYANRGTIFGKIVWGKLTYREVHEDTQRVVELDEYLATHEEQRGP